MKIQNKAIGLSLLFVFFAVIASIAIYSAIPLAAKLAFFAFGFGAGIAYGRGAAVRR